MAADTARSLLEEGDRLVAQIHALDDKPDAGMELACLYLRLEDVVKRARVLLGEERP
ncbi:hypothetical protein [Billgrantia ethanolica]|uniref:Uncharacterized protein n=1 Tax=Billgrantia ethanolica TaxID=2733486 RepID=A0ABS9A5X9_9GAMM|nr:hypothetical protein [Halomonas ethanolica]MCE8004242.1 hypothetical protein [Halomonas ethanolica]